MSRLRAILAMNGPRYQSNSISLLGYLWPFISIVFVTHLCTHLLASSVVKTCIANSCRAILKAPKTQSRFLHVPERMLDPVFL